MQGHHPHLVSSCQAGLKVDDAAAGLSLSSLSSTSSVALFACISRINQLGFAEEHHIVECDWPWPFELKDRRRPSPVPDIDSDGELSTIAIQLSASSDMRATRLRTKHQCWDRPRHAYLSSPRRRKPRAWFNIIPCACARLIATPIRRNVNAK